MGKKKYYAVARGRNPGIYTSWFGRNGAEIQIKGFPRARYKGFSNRTEAESFLKSGSVDVSSHGENRRNSTINSEVRKKQPDIKDHNRTSIYTDGGCLNNPGPGGWGVVIIRGDRRQERSGGFRLTTNNRMELTACIEGLKALPAGASAMLYSDSTYVVNGITKGWAKKWRANNWMRNASEKALNADLWQQLLDLCELYPVDFVWVKGHAGVPENERCDRLAGQAATGANLPKDPGYESE